MKLFRIVYISRMEIGGDVLPGSIADILAVSRVNNRRCGVTGALLLGPAGFAQVLEGTAAAVGDTFERIQCDDQHDAVTVLALDPMAERQFGEWAMAFCEGAEVLDEAGVSLAHLAAAGGAFAQPVLDLLRRAMRGQEARTRTFGSAALAHLA